MGRLFGTDGVRGVANRDLTPDLVLALGRAAGSALAPEGGEVVVGRDTRSSGPMLEGALVAGLCSAGADARLAGIVTTPAVAWLTVHHGARAGAVISASHNPVADNGIKFFSAMGSKISPEEENVIEELMVSPPKRSPEGVDVGTASPLEDAEGDYLGHLAGGLEGVLGGLTVVLDCAYGAAWALGPEAFRRAGAEVVAINAEPNGGRINVDCGSTSLAELSRRVVTERADMGLAFDGDADRVLAVDEKGVEVDGDRILAVLALDLRSKGELVHETVVATVMSNLGFRRALEERGVDVVTTPVGDRHVAEAMAETGAVLGGEQSGHIIIGAEATTGDGILTGLQLGCALGGASGPLSGLARLFEPFPQVLVNVPVRARDGLDGAEPVWLEVAAAERALGRDGRVLVRASGTEPLVRVMVEAAREADARRTADALAETVRRVLGA